MRILGSCLHDGLFQLTVYRTGQDIDNGYPRCHAQDRLKVFLCNVIAILYRDNDRNILFKRAGNDRQPLFEYPGI